jgi:hypothetical protein
MSWDLGKGSKENRGASAPGVALRQAFGGPPGFPQRPDCLSSIPQSSNWLGRKDISGDVKKFPGSGPAPCATSPRQNARDRLFDDGAVTTAVHLDVHSPKDTGCNACRNKSLHVEILATPKMDEVSGPPTEAALL